MLLKIGVALCAVAAVLAAVAIAVVAARDVPVGAATTAETTAEEPPPQALQRSYRERPKPPAEPAPREDESTPLPAGNPGWPMPENGELQEERRFAPASDANLTLTLPSLGVFDAPVFDSDSNAALEAGVGHVPETSMPWDEGAQRNTYLAAHRLGYQGTGSRLLFYELDQLQRGDKVILKGQGKTYRYRVTETMVVDPNDRWVMGQVVGRDMVTLQTCTPIPTFEKRLIVRADRV